MHAHGATIPAQDSTELSLPEPINSFDELHPPQTTQSLYIMNPILSIENDSPISSPLPTARSELQPPAIDEMRAQTPPRSIMDMFRFNEYSKEGQSTPATTTNVTDLEVGAKRSDDADTFADFVNHRNHLVPFHAKLDPKEAASLILGAERTLFAALNNAWLLSLGGIGLMSVGNGDNRATLGGVVILALGIICAVLAYMFHVLRVVQLKRNVVYPASHTILWATIIVGLTVTVLVMELYFGILHPYLQRSAAVTITHATPAVYEYAGDRGNN